MGNPAQMDSSHHEVCRTLVSDTESSASSPSSRCASTANPASFTPVTELFAAQCKAAPHSVGVVAGANSLTYGELDSRANQLARHLRACGVGPEVLVGLCLGRSLDFVVGALAILRAGGAYLPLDPATPRARILSVLTDARAFLLITAGNTAAELKSAGCRVLAIDSHWPSIAQLSSGPLEINVNAANLAYVIYTSGSTGEAKGVEISHGSLSNLLAWHRTTFAVTSADRATQLASPGFDAAVWELWPYLTSGASVHIPDKFTVMDPVALRDWLLSQRISISFVPTPLAERLMALDWPSKSPLRYLLTGADTLRHFPSYQLPFALVNNYGPTECTVVATSGTVPACKCSGAPPIGRPIDGVRVYVLDANKQQAQVNVTGELYLAGAGLARGYRNNPQLTAEKFIPDPFAEERGARMYKTGDLGCYLPDGQIAFRGRVDDQVKIRGYRIEPHEIVSALDRHPAVRMSVVVAREEVPGEKRLVAYVSLAPDSQITQSELTSFLAKSLPTYMMPSCFVRLDELPLTANGKIDRAALPPSAPGNLLGDKSYVGPRTLVEERLHSILCPLLQLDTIGVEDNFFMLGGHSLLGTQLIARIRTAFGVEITLRILFDNPTIAGIAAEIEHLILAKLDIEESDMVQENPSEFSNARGD
jgi:amino acid adenylation domain-containing protein